MVEARLVAGWVLESIWNSPPVQGAEAAAETYPRTGSFFPKAGAGNSAPRLVAGLGDLRQPLAALMEEAGAALSEMNSLEVAQI